MSTPEAVVAGLAARGATVATAESVTGGAVCSALVGVPGASAVVRGGVVAYTVEMKERLLGLPASLIGSAGVVSEAVAIAMAGAVRGMAGATFGIGTTGVAGPEPHGGLPAGTVCIAVDGPDGAHAETLVLAGGREDVRAGAVRRALDLIAGAVGEDVTEP